MDKVIVRELDAYSWDCPKCGQYNCHDKYITKPICDGCATQFEIESIEK